MQNQKKGTELVLVTGGSGFIATYCIITLLNNGYNIRASMRSLTKANEVKDMLRQGGIQSFENLSFVKSDLDNESSWEEAVKGCTYVIHTASPSPNTNAKSDEMY